MIRYYVVLLLSIVTITDGDVVCGPAFGEVLMAGSRTVFPLAEKWANKYEDYCENVLTVKVETGGSGVGAGRVCANLEDGSPVDIGVMSREWRSLEAAVAENSDPWIYKCLQGDESRSAAQFPVAIDAVAVVVQNSGIAAECISRLGGLSLNQLRWMFSSYSEEKLNNTSWDPNVLANSDGDDETHLWSELHKGCPDDEIKIAGSRQSGNAPYDIFLKSILIDYKNGETFAPRYNNSDVAERLDYVEKNDDAVAFFWLGNADDADSILAAVPVENTNGVLVPPTTSNVADGLYDVLARFLFMNLDINSTSLPNTLPYLEFGYTDDGDTVTAEEGFVPLGPAYKAEMVIQRISKLYSEFVWTAMEKRNFWCGQGQTITTAGSNSLFPVMKALTEKYQDQCPDYRITVDKGGSSAGAGRVCANEKYGTPVMIGGMSRSWKETEAMSKDQINFRCIEGKTSIDVTHLPVGMDGVTLVVQSGGVADECISKLGGLTDQQIRWIFSNFTFQELFLSGWKPESVPKSDVVESLRKWSHLHQECSDEMIKVAGPNSESGTFDFFTEHFLAKKDEGETMRSIYFSSADDEDVLTYIQENSGAIGYFGYGILKENDGNLTSVAVANSDGIFVLPKTETIANESYPLNRVISLNVNKEFKSEIYHFLRFMFSSYGTEIIENFGYVPISSYPTEWREIWMRVGTRV